MRVSMGLYSNTTAGRPRGASPHP
ncbi:hypothetical protein HYPGJ_31665 [Hyphomicrobium sp. GJ21]|nr:hypothetical protein HYPGJ_31665 [Hyphomicrobium sp. GJ21]